MFTMPETGPEINSEKKRRKWPVIPAAALALLLAALFIFAPLINARSVRLEAGDTLSAGLFFRGNDPDAQLLTDLSEIDPTVPGQYTVEIRTRLGIARRTLCIQDTTPPAARAQDVQTFLGILPDPADCITGLSDATDVSICYAHAPDVAEAGLQAGAVLLTDAAGNETQIDISVLVIADTAAPVISGAQDRTMYVGFPVDLTDGVSVSDDYDEAPQLSVDDSTLNTEKGGEYSVVYTAKDFSGNASSVRITVTVIEDTTAPLISGLKNHTFYAGTALDVREGITVSDDHDENPVLTIDEGGLDTDTPGEYTVVYTATDFSGNTVIASSHVTVLDDTTPPVIKGVQNHTVFVGDTLDLLSGVSVSDEQDPAPRFSLDDSRVDLATPGVYAAIYTAVDNFGNESTAAAKITVVADTEKPVISGVKDHTVYLGDPLDYTSGISATDNRDSELSIEIDASTLDLNTAGTYTIRYTCTDSSGNTAVQTSKVRVKKDTEAPVISGAKDISVELGGTVSYKKGVTVTDNHDSAPTLTIDNSAVNLNKIGTYKVRYIATDDAGNTRTVSVRLKVTRKTLTEDDLDIIWPMADEVLSSLISDDMSDMQKAFRIYGWTKKHIRYSGSSDKSHWVMGAYDGFTSRSGDCFTFFSVSKTLLTRAGIDNIDVVKSDTRYSRHYWSLINIGTGWYHFDSCPFSAPRDNFFMVTDKELAKWDATYRNAHPFDSSLYPERATESVQGRLNYSKFTVKE